MRLSISLIAALSPASVLRTICLIRWLTRFARCGAPYSGSASRFSHQCRVTKFPRGYQFPALPTAFLLSGGQLGPCLRSYAEGTRAPSPGSNRPYYFSTFARRAVDAPRTSLRGRSKVRSRDRLRGRGPIRGSSRALGEVCLFKNQTRRCGSPPKASYGSCPETYLRKFVNVNVDTCLDRAELTMSARRLSAAWRHCKGSPLRYPKTERMLDAGPQNKLANSASVSTRGLFGLLPRSMSRVV
jgi:hypothetical protein